MVNNYEFGVDTPNRYTKECQKAISEVKRYLKGFCCSLQKIAKLVNLKASIFPKGLFQIYCSERQSLTFFSYYTDIYTYFLSINTYVKAEKISTNLYNATITLFTLFQFSIATYFPLCFFINWHFRKDFLKTFKASL